MLDLFVLQSSSHYQTVIKGKDNWLFLAQENAELNVVEDYRSRRLFSARDLARWWRSTGSARMPWTPGVFIIDGGGSQQAHRVSGIFALAVQPGQSYSPHQSVGGCAAGGRVNVLDLRETALTVKKGALAYYRTGHPLDHVRGFAGYIEIMRWLTRWYPEFEPTIRGDYDIHITPGLDRRPVEHAGPGRHVSRGPGDL